MLDDQRQRFLHSYPTLLLRYCICELPRISPFQFKVFRCHWTECTRSGFFYALVSTSQFIIKTRFSGHKIVSFKNISRPHANFLQKTYFSQEPAKSLSVNATFSTPYDELRYDTDLLYLNHSSRLQRCSNWQVTERKKNTLIDLFLCFYLFDLAMKLN